MLTFPVTLFAGAAEFPSVKATNTSATNASQTSHTINLPSGITAGDLLIIFFGIGNSTVTATITGFTELTSQAYTNGRLRIFTKTATGAEGATVTGTTSANATSSETTYRISGWSSVEASTTSGSGANPDPPNLAPSWATTKTLWLAATSGFVTVGNTLTVSTFPSTFSNGIQQSWSLAVTPGGVCGSAQLESEVASLNPGTFALSTGSGVTWASATLGIKPA